MSIRFDDNAVIINQTEIPEAPESLDRSHGNCDKNFTKIVSLVGGAVMAIKQRKVQPTLQDARQNW